MVSSTTPMAEREDSGFGRESQEKTVKIIKCVECGFFVPDYPLLFDHLEAYHPGVMSVSLPEGRSASGGEDERSPRPTELEYDEIIDAIILAVYENQPPENLTEITDKLDQIIEYTSNSTSFRFPIGSKNDLQYSIFNRFKHYEEIVKKSIQDSPSYALCVQDWIDVDGFKFIKVFCRYLIAATSDVRAVAIGFILVTEDEPFLGAINHMLEKWAIDVKKVVEVTTDMDLIVNKTFGNIFGDEKMRCNSFRVLSSVAITSFQIDSLAKRVLEYLYANEAEKEPKCYMEIVTKLKAHANFAIQRINSIPGIKLTKMIFDLIDIFDPFVELAKEFERKVFVPNSEIIPMVKCLRAGLALKRPQNNVGKLVKEGLYKGVTGAFQMEADYNDQLAIPMLLDPRFKVEVFNIGGELGQRRVVKRLRTMANESQHRGIWKYHKSTVAKKLVKKYLAEAVIPLDKNPIQYFSKNFGDLRGFAEKHLVSAEVYPPVVHFNADLKEQSEMYSFKVHFFLASVKDLIRERNSEKISAMARDFAALKLMDGVEEGKC